MKKENEPESCSDDCGCRATGNKPQYCGECHADESLTASDGLITTTSIRGIRGNDLASRPAPSDCGEDCDNEADVSRNKIHDLVIKQMDYGYLVKAGCQTLCVETQDHLIALFGAYVRDYGRVRKLHATGKLDTIYVDDALEKMGVGLRKKDVRPERNIGVIGSCLRDVKNYLSDIVPLAVRGSTALKKYMLETRDYIIYYHAITTVNDTRSMEFDRITETHTARDNQEFEKIMTSCVRKHSKL